MPRADFPADIHHLFHLGMKRHLPRLMRPLDGIVLELGPGNNPMPGTTPLELPDWNAETDPIPYEDKSVAAIYAFHFLEHLDGAAAIRLLREVQRVLKVGGIFTVMVPYGVSGIALQDLDHKSRWNEDTWRVLFANPYYNKNALEPWRFSIGLNAIIGTDARTLMLATQLMKVGG